MKDELGREIVRCSYHIHAKLADERRYLRLRCKDGRCPDAVIAKDRGQIAIHVFDLWTPQEESEILMRTEFEYPSGHSKMV